ncbi:MAG: hemolysin III family protein [bacterium]|nr:hemolysin III family protein [bacterium]
MSLGSMQNPVRGFLHGGATLLFTIGAVLLWTRSQGPLAPRAALVCFGLSLIGLYSVSSLYHSVPWSTRWKERMRRLDHSMIYVLIAGSFTPIAFILLDGWLCGVTLAAAWSITLIGVLQKLLAPRVHSGFSAGLQVTQGWLVLPLLGPLSERLPIEGLQLAVFGGLLYTVGFVLFVTQRPRLWPRVFSYHETFHLFVIGGSASHYALALAYLVPLV